MKKEQRITKEVENYIKLFEKKGADFKPWRVLRAFAEYVDTFGNHGSAVRHKHTIIATKRKNGRQDF